MLLLHFNTDPTLCIKVSQRNKEKEIRQEFFLLKEKVFITGRFNTKPLTRIFKANSIWLHSCFFLSGSVNSFSVCNYNQLLCAWFIRRFTVARHLPKVWAIDEPCILFRVPFTPTCTFSYLFFLPSFFNPDVCISIWFCDATLAPRLGHLYTCQWLCYTTWVVSLVARWKFTWYLGIEACIWDGVL